MPDSSLTRRRFLQTTAAAAASASLVQADTPSPNIILILADDLGYGDIGAYGCDDIATPHIDRLAQQGARFTDSYSSCPVCSPTRCALMTGRYHNRIPDFDWVVSIAERDREKGLHPSEPTIAMMLQKTGYATACFGKWHLGYRDDYGPLRHGFDEFFGFKAGNIDYFKHIRADFLHDLYENETETHQEGYITDLITERAVDFIHRKKDQPFFLYVPFNAPHYPFQAPQDQDVELTRENWIQYGDRTQYIRMVERIDWGIGQILDAVEKNGLAQNTFIVFLSDNGGDRHSRNEPLSGRKGGLREGGIRVPCIMSMPGLIPEGKTVTQPAITMDVSATLLDLAGIRPIRLLDGMSLMRHLTLDVNDVQTTFFWNIPRRSEKAARWGKWKWLHQNGSDFLFQLQQDPAETTDVKTSYIDILHEIRSQHHAWWQHMLRHQQQYSERIQRLEG